MYPEEMQPAAAPQAGYVYLMRDAHDDYKIGHSVNPGNRRKLILRESKQKHGFIEIVLTIPTDDMIGLELALQRRFDHLNIEGEWFRLSKEEVTEIRLIRLQMMCEADTVAEERAK